MAKPNKKKTKMIKKFNENSTQPTRALQIWLILISKASNRQTLTYKMLAQLLGFKGSGTLAHYLGHIQAFCCQNDLPPLTVLVVNQESGLPGSGFIESSDLPADREKVFNYDWFGIFPPSHDELGNAFDIWKQQVKTTEQY